jgi:hypothetical protein
MSLNTLAIFGPNPDTNSPAELDLRLRQLKDVLLTSRPLQLVFLGGEAWQQNGREITEAELIAQEANRVFPELLPREQITLPIGLETISQTHALMDFLDRSRVPSVNSGVISSWHQLLRSSAVFLTNGRQPPVLFPNFYTESAQTLAYDVGVNAIAGVGYTVLAEMLQKVGIWKDGGPFVNQIKKERSERKGFSWFNTKKFK